MASRLHFEPLTRLLLCFALIVFSIAPTPAHAGFEIGNGGDAVFCKPGGPFPAGVYALDYIASSAAARPDDLARVDSLAASTLRIETLLREKVPSLASDFAIFSKNFLNTTDYALPQVWEPVAFALVDLNDALGVGTLPPNCGEGDGQKLRQAVIRTRKTTSSSVAGQRIFKFVPSVIRDLESTSPVQLSFLLVHEWLWDYSHGVENNRRVAAFLHSSAFEKVTPEEATKQLLSMGFPVPWSAPDGLSGFPCTGESISTAEIHARYAPHFAASKLGDVRAELFSRDLCPDSMALCNRGWKRENFFLPAVLQEGLSARVWYGSSDAFDPIKVINSEAIRNGTYRASPTDALVSCRTPVQGDAVTSCQLSEALNKTLRWQEWDGRRLQFEGVVAQNCMNIQGTFERPLSFVGHDGRTHASRQEVRLVISGLLRWPD
jgi:hypothetical protein